MPEPKDVERCEYMHVHEAIVNQVNQNMPDEEVSTTWRSCSKSSATPPALKSCTSSLNQRCASATSPSSWA